MYKFLLIILILFSTALHASAYGRTITNPATNSSISSSVIRSELQLLEDGWSSVFRFSTSLLSGTTTAATSSLVSFTNGIFSASSTLSNFTSVLSTTTSATSTNLYVFGASVVNTASSTNTNLTMVNSTTTNATTTNLSVTKGRITNFTSTNSTTTNATTTSLGITGQAASSGTNCVQIDTNGALSKTGSACVAGTVTSVGLSLPSVFTITNSPVSGSGTLTGAISLPRFSLLSTDGAGTNFGATTSDPIILGSVIASSTTNKSGIGTTSPFAFFSINPGVIGAGPLFAIGSSSATHVVVTNTGKVGVATTAPWGLFSVNPNSLGTAPEFVVGSSSATHMVIDGAGRIAFGTSSPNWALQVNATRPSFVLSDSGQGSGLKHWAITSEGGNLYIGTTTDTYSTTTVSALTLLNGGKVGIASSSPWAKLSVHVNPGETTDPIFAVGSSTPTATTTTFSVRSGGAVTTCLTIYGVNGAPATSTSMVLDWKNTCNEVDIKIGTSAVTVTLINATTSDFAGSRKLVNIFNPGGTAGAITWVGAEWYAASQPAQTTTGNYGDSWSFHVTSASSTLASPAYKVFGAITTGAQ